MTVVSVVEETLATRGRSHNSAGPKPPTWKRVKRTTVEELTLRYCSRCGEYKPPEAFRRGKHFSCKDCLRGAADQSVLRIWKSRWRSAALNARRRGIVPHVTWDEWRTLIEQHDATCSTPGCGRPYEVITHRTPFNLGGEHALRNLIVHCQPCNYAHVALTRRERWAV